MTGVLVQIETPTKTTFQKNSALLGIMEISQNHSKLYNELNELQKILRKIVFGGLHGKKIIKTLVALKKSWRKFN